jgi:23S rRNA pseudouridine1911/1915/1917 synthase
MSNIISYEIDESQNNMKLKDYLKSVAKFSSRLTREAAREERIKVNNKVARLSFVLSTHDKIDVELNKQESQNIEPEKMDLDIIYEDVDLLVVNKAPGIVVHPTKNYPYGTLANGLLYYFKESGQDCIVRLVSRLDRDTSGLILIAKNQFSHMSLARDMQKEDFEKSYLALIHGHMSSDSGTIDAPIMDPSEDNIKREVNEEGKVSITHYKVIEKYKNGELLKLTLETGRTHQIRVHLSNLGCPIYGDSLYGDTSDEVYIERQALHAYKLTFPHPRTGEKVALETEIPEDMKVLIERLKIE